MSNTFKTSKIGLKKKMPSSRIKILNLELVEYLWPRVVCTGNGDYRGDVCWYTDIFKYKHQTATTTEPVKY